MSRFRPYQFLLEHTGLTHPQFGKMRGKGTVINVIDYPEITLFNFGSIQFIDNHVRTSRKSTILNLISYQILEIQVTTYLEENNLIEPCIAWLEKNYPGERCISFI